MAASLPYHEPGIEDILVLSTFLLALNLINSALDRTLYCGLVGQVLVGVVWGTPGGKWLSSSLEDAIVQLGYLGLIMIVFEGGLSTSIATMRANLLLSVCVALTGIAAPMALSFFLAPMVGASYIQCFAAGAALCSTSLGTTFTVLSTSGLVSTRLGSVLSTAAMMDDVIGLVMVQIVSSLGSGSTDISPATVLRPILVSLAFAVLVPSACRFLQGPLMTGLDGLRAHHADTRAAKLSRVKQTVFVIQTALLIALVVGASYAGASALLAAYLAGIVGAWWDEKATSNVDVGADPLPATTGENTEESPSPATASPSDTTRQDINLASLQRSNQNNPESPRTSASDMFEVYYAQALKRVLTPLFFASIGFSIPISKMFSGPVVWRGIVYTILMLLGKALCGFWLVRFSAPLKATVSGACSSMICSVQALLRRISLGQLIHQSKGEQSNASSAGSRDQAATLRELQANPEPYTTSMSSPDIQQTKRGPGKPLSLYPAGILSFAMVARGEIGFLISSVAESNGIFQRSPSSTSSDEASEIFLIITWAIVLCTIIGPLSVGLLVRRVRKLEAGSLGSQVEGDRKNVLGVWGVS